MKNKKIIFSLPLICMSFGAQANSFIEDTKVDVLNRNFYFYRDFRNGGFNSSGENSQLPLEERQGYRSEWAHGIVAQLNSGYTDTPIQIGFNAHTLVGIKLSSDPYDTGTNLLEFDPKTGHTDATYAELGGAIKVKYKNTTLTYGDQFPNHPVIAVSTVRLLPSTATGVSLQDQSFQNISLEAGYFYQMSPVDSPDRLGKFTTDYAAGIEADSITFMGSKIKGQHINYSLYASELEDIWQQYYVGIQGSYSLNQEGHGLRFATANYYNKETGKEKAGELESLALSALLGYQYRNHVLSLGYQQIIGDEPFDWVAFKTLGANTSILNAAQFATFSEANEKSVQVKYELDFSPYGYTGLSLMGRYLYGWDIDNADSSNAFYTKRYVYDPSKDYSHWERDITLAYKVPHGLAKGLDIKLRQATHRADKGYRYNDIDELRVILEYPVSF